MTKFVYVRIEDSSCRVQNDRKLDDHKSQIDFIKSVKTRARIENQMTSIPSVTSTITKVKGSRGEPPPNDSLFVIDFLGNHLWVFVTEVTFDIFNKVGGKVNDSDAKKVEHQ